MTLFGRIVRDPLLHFLLAGALLFVGYRALHRTDASADARTIIVDKAALVTFMQNRAAAFQSEHFDREFAALSPEQLRELIDRYVREEALVREAAALGLTKGDYVMRRRMAEKMLYLIDDAATASFEPSRDDLQKYFSAHAERYRIAPTLTFTHVFVDNEGKRRESGEQAAVQLKRELEAHNAAFDDAPRYGDRFPYLQNYVQRAPDFIESQFGAPFAAALAKLEPSTRWQGPIASNLGWHVVLLTKRDAGYLPKLDDALDEVKGDLLRETVAAYRETALADLMRRFTVKLDGLAPAPVDRSTSPAAK